jgi:riboflavin kinase/FMN adenylyltransferase
MRGPVVPGDQRGRTLGFPTANVAVPDEMLMPADGIYAGWIQRLGAGSPGAAMGDDALPAAIYVGKRPTFYDDQAMTLLEVHVLDFAGDLYGERVAVRLTHRIRADAKFASVDELTAQLQLDCDRARVLLGVSPG